MRRKIVATGLLIALFLCISTRGIADEQKPKDFGPSVKGILKGLNIKNTDASKAKEKIVYELGASEKAVTIK